MSANVILRTAIRMRMGLALATVLLTAACGGGGSQAQSVESMLEPIRAKYGLPAMGGAIITQDGLRAAGVTGVRRANSTSAVTADDKWHIGSNFKAVTAAVAAISVEQGKLSWTTTIGDAFPELATEPGYDTRYSSVTLEQLLAHLGGITADVPVSGATPAEQRLSGVVAAVTTSPAGPIGQFLYSNAGYLIAGAMIERGWGSPFEQVIQEQLWTPLKLKGTGWGPPSVAGANDQPVGHTWNGMWVPCDQSASTGFECDNPAGYAPAGTAHMPLADWAAIIHELMAADAGTSTLISHATGRKLTTAAITDPVSGDGYALGWVTSTRDWAGGRTLSHEGSNKYNHSVAWVALDGKFAVVVTTNAAVALGGTTSAALDEAASRLITYQLTGE